MKTIGLAVAVFAVSGMSSVWAEPVTVRYTEGVTRGFPVLRSTTGEKLAQGELTQVARADRVDSRLVFRFFDGSYYDEQVVFSQQATFTLESYRLVQRGPSFPETLEASLDRETERYTIRYRADEDSPEEMLKGKFSLPTDAYNGMLTMLLKNLPAGASQVVQIVAFTPKPRLVKMLLAPVTEERVLVGEWPLTATRYMIKPQLGLFASLLVSDLPDVKCWVVGGDAPGFLRFEGPLYFMGPVWRIEPN
ncbi:MAG: hypothetical protein HYR51_07005 [Candidatus Rokubacteria bacterium]|nr:hypothetical protein [Candidatus Rokubacteria bacterium]